MAPPAQLGGTGLSEVASGPRRIRTESLRAINGCVFFFLCLARLLAAATVLGRRTQPVPLPGAMQRPVQLSSVGQGRLPPAGCHPQPRPGVYSARYRRGPRKEVRAVPQAGALYLQLQAGGGRLWLARAPGPGPSAPDHTEARDPCAIPARGELHRLRAPPSDRGPRPPSSRAPGRPARAWPGRGTRRPRAALQGDGSQHRNVVPRATQPQRLRRFWGKPEGTVPMPRRRLSHLGQASRSSNPGHRPRLAPFSSTG
ncbi:hypothetical protein NDU88_005578 [Pleurodeles waltl]|uniref:Uncharacterized protein n=1 Tax=Pleurodeles waltl TaxID=8319 RepID=A0AAV7LN61_PLEWA|nr:hypothetical protein NDU88_005578 [Pleurodeles waltl]